MGPRDGREARLRHAFGLPLGDIEEAIAAACRDDVFDRATVEAIAAAYRAWGTATGLNTCDVIAAWLAGDGAARAARLADLSGIVLKKDGESRSISAGLVKAASASSVPASRPLDCFPSLLALRAQGG